MPTVIYEPPSGGTDTNLNVDELRNAVLSWPSDYWRVGSGGAILRFADGNERTAMLLVLPHVQEQHGIYLKYSGSDKQEWLSVHDRSKLDHVAECADEWYASVGLFLPKELAWVAIEEFIRSGTKSAKVHWIQPDEVPENGNW